MSIDVIGSLAYVSNNDHGLRIYDVSDPTGAVLIGAGTQSRDARGAHVVGTLAYVANGEDGLSIIQVAASAQSVTQIDATTYRIDLAAELAEGPQRVTIMPDLTDQAGNTMDQDRDGVGGEAAEDEYVLAITVDGIPRVVGHSPDGDTGPVDGVEVTFGEPVDEVSLAGGVRIVPPGAPTEIGAMSADELAGAAGAGSFAYGVTVVDDVAYVADEARGLQIVDIADPDAPVRLGSIDTPGSARAVAVQGGLAFVADYAEGLHVIDVTDPTAPALVGTIDSPGYACDVTVVGDLAYVADYSAGLHVVDVSNPAAPALLGTYNTTGFAFDVAVADNLAYVADGSKGLAVIDVTDPSAPQSVGTLDTPGSAMGVVVHGDTVLVGDYAAGVVVIDASNPAAPVLIGTYDTPGAAYDVTLSGPLAFVADYGAGLLVLDVTDPSAPQLVTSADTPGAAHGVAVAGAHAYVADETGGVRIFEVLVETTGMTQTAAATYRLDLPGVLPDGEYQVFVGPDVTDVAGNPMDQDGDGLPGELTDAYAWSFTTSAVAAQTEPAALAGDVDGSGVVDAADYIAVKRRLGRSVSASGSGADLDGDGVVGLGDLSAVMTSMGRPTRILAQAAEGETATGLVGPAAEMSADVLAMSAAAFDAASEPARPVDPEAAPAVLDRTALGLRRTAGQTRRPRLNSGAFILSGDGIGLLNAPDGPMVFLSPAAPGLPEAAVLDALRVAPVDLGMLEPLIQA